MCGIIGAAGDLEYRDKDVIQTLMHLCELRGEDSTGYFTVSKDSEVPTMFKNVGPTRYMFDTLAWDKLSLYNKRVFIGHCRKATVGVVSRTTAHPFVFGGITGVHNGTLRNWRSLPGDNEVTDSAMLYKNFSETGVRETIEATDGAYALIWWDEHEGLLNILKNDERPLFYCFSEDCKKLFWASEAWMLSVALSRGGIKMANLNKKGEAECFIKPVENDVWWRVRPGAKGDKDAITFLKDEDLKGGVKKAGYSHRPFQQGQTAYNPFGWEEELDDNIPEALRGTEPINQRSKGQEKQKVLILPDGTNKAVGSTSTTSSSLQSKKTNAETSRPKKTMLTLAVNNKNDGSDELNIGPHLLGNKGLILSEEEFTELVDPNCIWCQQPYDFEELKDQGKLGEWMTDDTFVCSSCLHETKLNGVV